jgi:hypothetical protein
MDKLGDLRLRTIAIVFFLLQGSLAACWWALLLAVPLARQPFVPTGAPDGVLLALIGGDFTLFIGGSFLSAYGLWKRRPWSSWVLSVHAGAATYVGLYGILLPMFMPCCRLGAILMLPSLVAPLYFAWRLRSKAL